MKTSIFRQKELPMKCFYILAFICLLCSLSARIAVAEEVAVFGNPQWHFMEVQKNFYVEKNDEVSDGCWRSTDQSVDRVKLELIRSGSKLENEKDFNNLVSVDALGYETSDYSCAVLVKIDVYSPSIREAEIDGVKVSGVFRHIIWGSSTLLTGPKSGMSKRIAETHESQIRSFLVAMSVNSEAFRKEVAQSVVAK